MNDLLMIAVMVVSAALLLYWFWPGPALCEACGSELDPHNFCLCTNIVCPYHVNQQTVGAKNG